MGDEMDRKLGPEDVEGEIDRKGKSSAEPEVEAHTRVTGPDAAEKQLPRRAV